MPLLFVTMKMLGHANALAQKTTTASLPGIVSSTNSLLQVMSYLAPSVYCRWAMMSMETHFGQGLSKVGESVILRSPDYCREYSGRRILVHVNRDPSGVPYSETCSEANVLVELGEILRFAQDDSPKFLGSNISPPDMGLSG